MTILPSFTCRVRVKPGAVEGTWRWVCRYVASKSWNLEPRDEDFGPNFEKWRSIISHPDPTSSWVHQRQCSPGGPSAQRWRGVENLKQNTTRAVILNWPAQRQTTTGLNWGGRGGFAAADAALGVGSPDCRFQDLK